MNKYPSDDISIREAQHGFDDGSIFEITSNSKLNPDINDQIEEYVRDNIPADYNERWVEFVYPGFESTSPSYILNLKLDDALDQNSFNELVTFTMARYVNGLNQVSKETSFWSTPSLVLRYHLDTESNRNESAFRWHVDAVVSTGQKLLPEWTFSHAVSNNQTLFQRFPDYVAGDGTSIVFNGFEMHKGNPTKGRILILGSY